jgi:hypothetical protein
MPSEVSRVSVIAVDPAGLVKLGQPQPESNLVLELKSAAPHPAQTYSPGDVVSQ